MWEQFNFFLGEWQGNGQGQSGASRIECKYELVLNDKFLFVKSKSVYEPQEKNSKGETNEEWGLMSDDRARKIYVFRQFHLEGFVNQYIIAEIVEDRKTIRFVTEAIENISLGWKARESYQILDSDEFIEIFELAAP